MLWFLVRNSPCISSIKDLNLHDFTGPDICTHFHPSEVATPLQISSGMHMQGPTRDDGAK